MKSKITLSVNVIQSETRSACQKIEMQIGSKGLLIKNLERNYNYFLSNQKRETQY